MQPFGKRLRSYDGYYIAIALVSTFLCCLLLLPKICPGCGPGTSTLIAFVNALGGGNPLIRYLPIQRTAPGNITLLAIGDSITFGLWSSGPFNGYRLCLLNLLTGTEPVWSVNQTVSPDALFQHVTYVGSSRIGNFSNNRHQGEGGETIARIQYLFERAVENYGAAPDAVLLMAGANDINEDVDLPRAPSRLGDLIDALFWRFPRTVVIVSELTPVKNNATLERRKIAFNEAVPALIEARERLNWKIIGVNMSAVFELPHDMADTLHPSDAGYAKMATEWLRGLTEAKDRGWFDWGADDEDASAIDDG
ncbi:hypothetical protein FH972_023095 [Carpinus fangiana]|uniref:SGNH hydrolase-type esterase domain-containing protein n=1 Tax=Carpinus fangiana TaxID=176857 RepID=A0A5N6KUN8_9ROSI|nr:hypothetical protein FH972_023095 [Carpinus fangiana]